MVGAGPVGLWTALELANAGVEVKIIDSENRTTARSYACALHPRTLEMLDSAGLAEPLISQGRKVDTVVFYDGAQREAEIKMSKSGGRFPFLVIVPQSALETALEDHLTAKGAPVQWMHRLDSYTRDQESISVNLEQLHGTSTGYVVPHWETTVRKEIPLRAQFIVGADGNHSVTRRRMKLDYVQYASANAFAAYEFESDEATGSEVRVVLSEDSTNVLWPLPGNKWRWTFQILHSDAPVTFPDKERRAVRLLNSTVDERVRDYVQRVAARRAPWFKAQVKDVTWCTKVAFEQRLASAFGQDRVWLAGDAAHQTGPVGIQSMNSGFAEGSMLAKALRQIIHDNGDMSLLGNYNDTQSALWRSLVGPGAAFKTDSASTPWVAKRAKRLLPCLPGLGEDLNSLASQLGLMR